MCHSFLKRFSSRPVIYLCLLSFSLSSHSKVENLEIESQRKGREIRTLETESKATVEKLEKLWAITKTLRAENANLQAVRTLFLLFFLCFSIAHSKGKEATGNTENLEKALERVELLENTLRKLKGIVRQPDCICSWIVSGPERRVYRENQDFGAAKQISAYEDLLVVSLRSDLTRRKSYRDLCC